MKVWKRNFLLGLVVAAAALGWFALAGGQREAPLKFHGYMNVQLAAQPEFDGAVFSYRPGTRHWKYLQLNEKRAGVTRIKQGTEWVNPQVSINTVEYDNPDGKRVVVVPTKNLRQPWRYDRKHEQFVVLKLPGANPRVIFKREILFTSGEMEPRDQIIPAILRPVQ